MDWLVLVYKLPTEPSRLRAGIWRKLKIAGAVYLQDGIATLPADLDAESLLHRLADEIHEMQGTAHLLRGIPLSDETALVEVFNTARRAEYTELIDKCRAFHLELTKERAVQNFTFAELEENEDEVAKLAAWLAKIQIRDRFTVSAQAEGVAALAACRDDLATFETEVHAAEHLM